MRNWGVPPPKMEVNRGVFEKYKDSQVGGGGKVP